jgi:lipopolysaccharide export LptBFGC system permease protein LptF
MNRLSRYIVKRMAINFVVLFTLFYLLGSVIDIIVNLDEFVTKASEISKDGGFVMQMIAIVKVSVGYEGPRLFQVFSLLHGVIAIGAMAFTTANMFRSREFVALMAAGISLRQIALPLLVVMVGVSAAALLNQEYMLPKVAPLLLRGYGEAGENSAASFPIPFTPDQSGALLLAVSLNPDTNELTEPSFLRRDEVGRMIQQIQAESANWDFATSAGWFLKSGRSVDIEFDKESGLATITKPVPVEYFSTELSPHILTLHRYGQYIGMLGMSQLNSMLDATSAFDAPMLRRHWYSRFASIALNLLAMAIVIPLFITRESVVLSRQAVLCGAVGLTIMFGGSVLMLMPIAGFPAVVSVFLPSLILMPIAILRIVTIKT